MDITKPIIVNMAAATPATAKEQYGATDVCDTYAQQLEEVFLLRNPRFRFAPSHDAELNAFINEHAQGKDLAQCGTWFYFPWSKKLVHYLPEAMHLEMRTGRNRNIITAEEQEKLYNATIAVAGLSVGSHAASTIAIMGMAKTIKLADPDAISGSNLNRIRADVTTIGENKCDLMTRAIYQINPYAEIISYPGGITDENITAFLNDPKPAVLVEEIDNLEMKIRLRLEAKKYGVPVIMATDNGDNIIVDVERYDVNPDIEIFNGAIGHITLEEFRAFPPQELPRLATKIAGAQLITSRMQQSLLEVGRTLYSWPQPADAATLAGVAIAYGVKRIITNAPIKSGKFEINLDAIFDDTYNHPDVIAARDAQRETFLKTIGL